MPLGETQQEFLSANNWTKCAKKWIFLLPKPDISDFYAQPISDLNKSGKAGLLRAFALAMT